VELAAVTVNIDDCPEVTVVGLALMSTVGAAGGITVTVVVVEVFPPAPVPAAV
jgi:hypothetical protein